MASSFGSLAFQAERDGAWIALPSQDALVTERPIPYAPGGGIVVVDRGGLAAYHYDAEITVQPADVAGWLAAIQTTATLTVADVSYGDAELVALTNARVLFDRTVYAFSARFVLNATVA